MCAVCVCHVTWGHLALPLPWAPVASRQPAASSVSHCGAGGFSDADRRKEMETAIEARRQVRQHCAAPALAATDAR